MANTPLSLSLYMQVYLPTGIFGEGLFYFCLNGRLRLAIFYLQIMVSARYKKASAVQGRMLFLEYVGVMS